MPGFIRTRSLNRDLRKAASRNFRDIEQIGRGRRGRKGR